MARKYDGKPGARFRSGLMVLPMLVMAACTAETADVASNTEAAAKPAGDVAVSATPEEVYWGNFHLHTKLSSDAFVAGTRRFDPEQAYRYARGEEVTSDSGQTYTIPQPLDFLMVSDHAEFLGVLAGANEGDPLLAGNALVEEWSGYAAAGQIGLLIRGLIGRIDNNDHAEISDVFNNSTWKNVADTADRFNQPGRFTTFAGYEWTSLVSGDNLHRVVVFREGADTVTSLPPFSAIDSNDPERLWAHLERYSKQTGGQVLAIPHNPNLSEGSMFDTRTLSGAPFDLDYLRTRQRWEPVAEVSQGKGDSETHPVLSPDDEFADFETWDHGDIAGNERNLEGTTLVEQMRGEYARGALLRGLGFQAVQGVNPFQFGMIGDSDSHTGIPSAREDGWLGHTINEEFGAERMNRLVGGSRIYFNRDMGATGIAAVWARANTREEIFAAVRRREVYSSTGPRIRLRFFGGWDFTRNLLDSDAYVNAGYARGVPMGGVLPTGPDGAPRFMMVALKDPDAANLDRIQVVKGWRDADGTLREHVYDVALSDGRVVDPATGRAPRVGSTVNLETATYTNSIGAVELRSFWTDPDFDPAEQAFYYVRVLEIPTPRWTTYDAVRYGIERPKEKPAEIQERIYSSPIWYVPRS